MARVGPIPLISSAISSVTYDDETLEMDVEFESGSEYTYYNVPKLVFEAFVTDDSPGRFFHQRIKNQYG